MFTTGVNGGFLTTIRGHEEKTTNNRMELRAIIEAIRICPPGGTITIVSDSAYALGCLNKGRWGTANGDLKRELKRVSKDKTVFRIRVKGHNGDRLNDLADRVAHAARTGQEPTL